MSTLFMVHKKTYFKVCEIIYFILRTFNDTLCKFYINFTYVSTVSTYRSTFLLHGPTLEYWDNLTQNTGIFLQTLRNVKPLCAIWYKQTFLLGSHKFINSRLQIIIYFMEIKYYQYQLFKILSLLFGAHLVVTLYNRQCNSLHNNTQFQHI